MINLFNLFKNNNQKDRITKSILYAVTAESCSANKQYKKAICIITKAIKLNGKNDSFYYSRALMHFLMQNYKKAYNDINKALLLNSKIYYYYLLKADILIRRDNVQDNIDNIKSAAKLMPKFYLFYEYAKEKYFESDVDLSNFYNERLNYIKQLQIIQGVQL